MSAAAAPKLATVTGSAQRDVDEEDRPPAEGLGQHSAEQGAGHQAAAAGRPPHAQGPVPIRSLREHGGDQRQRGRAEDGAAEALNGAGGHEHPGGAGQAAGGGGERVKAQPGQQEPAAAQQVRQPAAEEQESTERDGISADHPLQALAREADPGPDAGQRDEHDAVVQRDDQLGQRQCHQDQRRAPDGKRRSHGCGALLQRVPVVRHGPQTIALT
jgi:hypothetical protein